MKAGLVDKESWSSLLRWCTYLQQGLLETVVDQLRVALLLLQLLLQLSDATLQFPLLLCNQSTEDESKKKVSKGVKREIITFKRHRFITNASSLHTHIHPQSDR